MIGRFHNSYFWFGGMVNWKIKIGILTFSYKNIVLADFTVLIITIKKSNWTGKGCCKKTGSIRCLPDKSDKYLTKEIARRL